MLRENLTLMLALALYPRDPQSEAIAALHGDRLEEGSWGPKGCRPSVLSLSMPTQSSIWSCLQNILNADHLLSTTARTAAVSFPTSNCGLSQFSTTEPKSEEKGRKARLIRGTQKYKMPQLVCGPTIGKRPPAWGRNVSSL